MASEVIVKVEELFEKKGNSQEIFEILSKAQKDYPENVEIIWRFARAHFDMADTKPDDKVWREDMLKKGVVHANKALELDDKNAFSHKWWAIMTSAVGEFLSQKDKIQNAFLIKEHALKANELKPKDSTTLHLLGRWCFNVASLGWFEKKAAAAFFATPPDSSFDEALKFFSEAYDVEPTFRRNLVFLGDTYVQLKKNDKAKEYYQKAIDIPSITAFDQALVNEAKQKMSKL